MTNSRSIQGILVLIVGIILAIWLGLSIATNQTETILQITGAAVFITCLASFGATRPVPQIQETMNRCEFEAPPNSNWIRIAQTLAQWHGLRLLDLPTSDQQPKKRGQILPIP